MQAGAHAQYRGDEIAVGEFLARLHDHAMVPALVIEILSGVAGIVYLITTSASGAKAARRHISLLLVWEGRRLGLPFSMGIRHMVVLFLESLLRGVQAGLGAAPDHTETMTAWQGRVWTQAHVQSVRPIELINWMTLRHSSSKQLPTWLKSRDDALEALLIAAAKEARGAESEESLVTLERSLSLRCRAFRRDVWKTLPPWQLLCRELLRYLDAAGRGGAAGLTIALLAHLLMNSLADSVLDSVAVATIVGSIAGIVLYNLSLLASIKDLRQLGGSRPFVVAVLVVIGVPIIAALISTLYN
jgi:hypothetical protein